MNKPYRGISKAYALFIAILLLLATFNHPIIIAGEEKHIEIVDWKLDPEGPWRMFASLVDARKYESTSVDRSILYEVRMSGFDGYVAWSRTCSKKIDDAMLVAKVAVTIFELIKAGLEIAVTGGAAIVWESIEMGATHAIMEAIEHGVREFLLNDDGTLSTFCLFGEYNGNPFLIILTDNGRHKICLTGSLLGCEDMVNSVLAEIYEHPMVDLVANFLDMPKTINVGEKYTIKVKIRSNSITSAIAQARIYWGNDEYAGWVKTLDLGVMTPNQQVEKTFEFDVPFKILNWHQNGSTVVFHVKVSGSENEFEYSNNIYDFATTIYDFRPNVPPVVELPDEVTGQVNQGIVFSCNINDPDKKPQPLSIKWDYGASEEVYFFKDGKLAYKNPGTYMVKATAFDGKDYASDTMKLSVRNHGVTAYLTYYVGSRQEYVPSEGLSTYAGTPLEFEVIGGDIDDYPVKYDWDFGDGMKLLDSDSKSVTHRYGFIGVYTLSVRVKNELFHTGRDTSPINFVNLTAKIYVYSVGNAPVVSIAQIGGPFNGSDPGVRYQLQAYIKKSGADTDVFESDSKILSVDFQVSFYEILENFDFSRLIDVVDIGYLKEEGKYVEASWVPERQGLYTIRVELVGTSHNRISGESEEYCRLTKDAYFAIGHILRITSLRVDPSYPMAGEEVRLSVGSVFLGESEASLERVSAYEWLLPGYGGVLHTTERVITHVFTFGGTNYVRVRVQDKATGFWSDWVEFRIYVSTRQNPDISILEDDIAFSYYWAEGHLYPQVKVSSLNATVGEDIEVYVTFRNRGNSTSHVKFTMTVQDEKGALVGKMPYLGYKTCWYNETRDVGSGEEATFSFIWETPWKPGTYYIVAKAILREGIKDAKSSDNEIRKPIVVGLPDLTFIPSKDGNYMEFVESPDPGAKRITALTAGKTVWIRAFFKNVGNARIPARGYGSPEVHIATWLDYRVYSKPVWSSETGWTVSYGPLLWIPVEAYESKYSEDFQPGETGMILFSWTPPEDGIYLLEAHIDPKYPEHSCDNNFVTQWVRVGLLPDLSVSEPKLVPPCVLPNTTEPVIVSVKITNEGNARSNGTSVKLYVDGGFRGETYLEPLDPGASKTVESVVNVTTPEMNATQLQSYAHRVSVRVDEGRFMKEFDKGNNYNGAWLPICKEALRAYAEPEAEESEPQAEPEPSETGEQPPPTPPPPEELPDLIISSLTVQLLDPLTCIVEVTVSNVGNAAAGPFIVTISDQPPGGSPVVKATFPVSGLLLGESFFWGSTITLLSPCDPAHPHLIIAFADATYQVVESNENNNSAQKQIP
ncbi:MAG: CARDB domain-containing protein [Thermoproteota archaeon]